MKKTKSNTLSCHVGYFDMTIAWKPRKKPTSINQKLLYWLMIIMIAIAITSHLMPYPKLLEATKIFIELAITLL